MGESTVFIHRMCVFNSSIYTPFCLSNGQQEANSLQSISELIWSQTWNLSLLEDSSWETEGTCLLVRPFEFSNRARVTRVDIKVLPVIWELFKEKWLFRSRVSTLSFATASLNSVVHSYLTHLHLTLFYPAVKHSPHTFTRKSTVFLPNGSKNKLRIIELAYSIASQR